MRIGLFHRTIDGFQFAWAGVLTADASGVGTWQAAPSGLWTESGGNAYRSSGNVGIGTASSNARLTVEGAGTTSSTLAIEATDSTGNTLFKVMDDGYSAIYGTLNIVTPNDGNFDPAPILRLRKNVPSGDVPWAILEVGKYDTGAPAHSKMNISLRHEGSTYADVLTVQSNGNVGIGATSPSQKLDVSGTIKSSGIQLGTTATTGHVLTTNASGVGTWQAAPSAMWSESGGNVYTQNKRLGE